MGREGQLGDLGEGQISPHDPVRRHLHKVFRRRLITASSVWALVVRTAQHRRRRYELKVGEPVVVQVRIGIPSRIPSEERETNQIALKELRDVASVVDVELLTSLVLKLVEGSPWTALVRGRKDAEGKEDEGG